MLDVSLFLGFCQDRSFREEIDKQSAQYLSFFIGRPEYLQEIRYDGRLYLGKPLPVQLTVCQLEEIETHLISLLKKLAPDYPFVHNPPVVLMIHER